MHQQLEKQCELARPNIDLFYLFINSIIYIAANFRVLCIKPTLLKVIKNTPQQSFVCDNFFHFKLSKHE